MKIEELTDAIGMIDDDLIMDANVISQKKHIHTVKRRLIRCCAVIATVLITGTITVGAANHWDYSEFFTNFFSEKSKSAIHYVFSGMGMDINTVIQSRDYTVNIKSLLADTENLYVAYDIMLNPELEEQISDCSDVDIIAEWAASVKNKGGNQAFSDNILSFPAEHRDDGRYYGISCIQFDSDIEVFDKKLDISLENVNIHFHNNKQTEMMTFNEIDSQQFSYDLQSITVQKGLRIPYGGTLPNDANKNIFETVSITPFMLHFQTSCEVNAAESIPSMRWGIISGSKREKEIFTAVYTDGTEREILMMHNNIGASTSLNRHFDSQHYTYAIDKIYYIAEPISLDNLQSIRINGFEINTNS